MSFLDRYGWLVLVIRHFSVTVTLIIRNPLKSDFKHFIDDMASSTVSSEPSVVAIVRC